MRTHGWLTFDQIKKLHGGNADIAGAIVRKKYEEGVACQ